MPNTPLARYRYFFTVSELGSVRAVSEALDVEPSVISRQIARLTIANDLRSWTEKAIPIVDESLRVASGKVLVNAGRSRSGSSRLARPVTARLTR